ncbi:tetratricopeptide (TPR) repeat protein/transcriptional regulator with XRE-family HTH domain [Amycolatopsis endophytica]|uniref:Tetratricopeptide (TPR) repeat protein/transcriptional regulator with XRE-family HTH domain n=1 Tax=Amycolatopsis endophytica TaxID=860233 RepID=A0A853BF48_9PSEU|nr:XRE family transcriptional regulator [Amycolatopsis endophytica]NYI93271.1 tetratricopeptide (TPR) repeat protein/transcriptional regulator with XRE-family HTH domain [Amycolatopsis endophytica]
MTEQATFGAELRRIRRAAGVSLTGLAERVHYSKGYLSKVETGLAAPHSALAALCEAELDAPGALTPLLPGTTARRRTRPDVRPSGLPPAVSNFTGRDEELRQVRLALEADGGVCVISGLGGVGKTELAIRCAHRVEASFPDGCLFVDLHGLGGSPADPAAVHDRLLRALGVPAESVPADPDDRAALYRTRMRGRGFLLVLDNAVTATQVRPLLPAEPNCRVLITSRSRLAALDEAGHVSLDVLPEAAAVELFTSLSGTSTGDAITRIVRRCGRLPLAVRIAAARLRTHPTWDAGELDRRLAAEGARLGELDDGERSVRAAFALSADQLPASEARLLGLLTRYPGTDFGVPAAAALGGLGTHETDRLLERLYDGHLLTQPSAGRYAFHDLVKSFASEKILDALAPSDRSAAFGRLLDFAVRTTELADRLIAPLRYRPAIEPAVDAPAPLDLATEREALDWLRLEWPNLVALCRAAGENGHPTRCWQLAYLLRTFYFLAKLWDAWCDTHRWARSAAEADGDRWALAVTTANLGVGLIDRGDIEAASVCYREALARYREIGDEHGESTVLAHQGWARHYLGDHAGALADLREALGFYERADNVRNAAITRRGIALVLTTAGRPGEAAAIAEATLEVFDGLGLRFDAVMSLNCLGWARFHSGEYERAADAYREALRRAESCGSPHEAARAHTGLGNIAHATGDREEAAVAWDLADETHPDLDPRIVGEAAARPRRG